MFSLFGKKEGKAGEDRVAECQKKKDWAGLAKAYYEMGVSAMEAGDLEHAQLWLHRADTIYSADDAVYEKVGDKITDDCSDRIGRLEAEEDLLYNAVPAEISEKAEELSEPQVRIWGCEVLGELGWAVDMMARSLQEPPTQEEYQHLMDVCNGLYELNGKPGYWCGQIDVPGGAPFQVFDLNGMMGVEQELNSFIDSHLRLIAALSQGVEDPAAAAISWAAPSCPTTTSAPVGAGWRRSLSSGRSWSGSKTTTSSSAMASPGRRWASGSPPIRRWTSWRCDDGSGSLIWDPDFPFVWRCGMISPLQVPGRQRPGE